ncbi:HugZ family pyridoxamine 5'-phosphate oxidase [Cellulosilyticum lentocellum]|uniref:Pyridoxamine 5'-phosphate oxidase-related FMN-binding protein n=1 Tax=Cellulosilyticum lentocellum (strain ATCC 49066 / DSM 5427 / NCIMB 11756 / RHM5) TaxID=642492 RepID=F2JKM1_CELLD|nr:pyridoxamine 5'-phosphate oxidase family protein [Cellulosilyticum lentocellum]ADZ82181.1 pyridoxamine 5'-phosphate oxidase-related FMN-binding protein [Cellulosilyticum lentocellum DSM 5427]
MEELYNQKTIMMSTTTKESVPAISYAPYVKIENEFYIFISETAVHYHHLMNNPQIAIMLIEDEKDTKILFARTRMTLNCKAKKLETINEAAWDLFKEQYGEQMMAPLKQMDFDMFQLTPENGRIVKGFGQASTIQIVNGEMVLTPITGEGHKKKEINKVQFN